MTVPVLWVSRYPGTILARGYADSGMLEAMLNRSLWRVPGAVELEHHEVFGDEWPDVDGAVVVLPARHHASPEDVEWFKSCLDALRWAYVFLVGDEDWEFPWAEIEETEIRRVSIMQPRPEHSDLSLLIPGGWSPGTPESFRKYRAEADERSLDWAFLGQVTHERREECVKALETLDNGYLLATEGYMQGIDREEYRRLIASAKVIPCPSGPMTVDTNRPLEAMECGAVPVCDLVTPRGDDFDYWRLCFSDDYPFPTVREWSEFPGAMQMTLDGWPASSNRVFAWWQQWKRDLCHRFENQLRELSGESPTYGADDLITVIVPTSPLERHPDTAVIEETIASIRAQLPLAEIIVVCDGVRPEQEHLTDSYNEYIKRLLWLSNFEWGNTVPVLLPEWGHQANATRKALELVTTPNLLFVEHDCPIFGDIDWIGLCGAIETGEAEAIRLSITPEILAEHEYMMVDHETQWVKTPYSEVPMRRSAQWWQRPHLAATDFYRDKVMPVFPETSRTMVEDKLHSVVQSAFFDHGEKGWWDWRLWVYTPDGDMQRSGHLDARDGAPKFEMAFE